MTDDDAANLRTERALLDATRPFAVESRTRSWWVVASTFSALIAALSTAAVAPWWPLRTVASLIGGLLFVRAFILFHDYQHGSLLRGSRFAQILFYVYGLVALTPARHWRHTHNFHHANVGKPIPVVEGPFSLVTSDVGSYSLMTTDMWRQASTWQRIRYRITRHPLIILFAYATVFLGSQCLAPLFENPRKNWDCLLSVLVHSALVAGLWWWAGLPTLFFAWWLPFAIASAMGSYLFFAQHNYPGMHILPIEEWTHFRGALESSSYMQLGPIMRWFTGNIGYHHVHHLNSHIPFYRLPEAMAAVPELQQQAVTSLRPSDIWACLRLNLWDPASHQLMSFREALSDKR